MAVLAGACSSGGAADDEPGAPEGSATPGSSTRELDPTDPALDVAVNEPVADSVYPDVGDPGVDALHYQLDLAWTPESTTLDAVETLTFRATSDADSFRLDFGEPLAVSELTLDGEPAGFEEDGKDLVVDAQVRADDRYTLEVHYSGTPEPVPAPTLRNDFTTIGWTVTENGETWTMQEPYGAYSWYAVNDHPSDKALYDFTISTPAPWVGVANGQLESREEVEGNTVTTWHLDEPAASYLATVAIGDLKMTKGTSDSGVPMTYWTPPGDRFALRAARVAGDELGWIEERLGEYPFSSLGILVVDGMSGMETQTMITLGNNQFALSPAVIVHEMVHQWYGDQVTPLGWRDVWMNEGMAMYLQALWESEELGVDLETTLDGWADQDQALRDAGGPPADFDPAMFGARNIYYLPALMWDEIRQRVGDETFWRLVRAWPQANDNGHASYDEITRWWSEETGEDLQPLFDAWLLGEDSPPYP